MNKSQAPKAYTQRMKPPSLLLRLSVALGITAMLLFDLVIWQHHRFNELPVWIWGALALSLAVLFSQWPQHSRLPVLRRVPQGWRVGMTMGLSMFLLSLVDHALPRPDWFLAIFMGLGTGLFMGYFWNQSYAAKRERNTP